MNIKQKLGNLMGARPPFEARRGQAIVIIMLLMVGLIAMMGIAIDGGRLFFIRRDTQNTTDAAVLAATFALCTGGTEAQIIQAGMDAAAHNGFVNDTSTSISVNPDPEGLPANTCAECAVEVVVSREVDPYFISIVYNGKLEATSRGVGSCRPNSIQVKEDEDETLPPIKAFWAGSQTCENTLKFTGSESTIVGGVHSNNDINAGGSQGNVNVYGESSFVTDLDGKADKIGWKPAGDAPGYEMVCGASCTSNSSGNNMPTDLPGPITQDSGDPKYPVDYKIQDYRPGGATALLAASTGNYAAYPSCGGANKGIDLDWLEANGYYDEETKIIQPGIYYSPCDIKIKFDNNTTSTSYVTFVAENAISINGTVNLKPYDDGNNNRLLLFAYNDDKYSCTQNGVHVSVSQSAWEGIIYAPKGNAQFSTASNSSFKGCVVAYTVENSSASSTIVCDPPELRNTISNAE